VAATSAPFAPYVVRPQPPGRRLRPMAPWRPGCTATVGLCSEPLVAQVTQAPCVRPLLADNRSLAPAPPRRGGPGRSCALPPLRRD